MKFLIAVAAMLLALPAAASDTLTECYATAVVVADMTKWRDSGMTTTEYDGILAEQIEAGKVDTESAGFLSGLYFDVARSSRDARQMVSMWLAMCDRTYPADMEYTD